MMWSYICMLPFEVVGQHVLASVDLKSLVKLDSAIMEHKQRAEFLELLNYCPPVAIHQDIQASNAELLWFKRRKCRIQEIKLSLSQSDYYDVDTSIADRVVLEVQRTIVSSDIDKLRQSLPNSTISYIKICEQQQNELIYSLFSIVPNVKELSIKSTGTASDGMSLTWLESLIDAGIIVYTFQLFVYEFTPVVANFIYHQGTHLKRLELTCVESWEGDPNEFLEELGRSCPELEELNVQQWVSGDDAMCDTGIIALIRSCRSLKTLQIPNFALTDIALIFISGHCVNLRQLKVSAKSLTYAALISLSKHHLPLVGLDIPWIPIPSAEVAAQCAHALSRIQRLQPTPATCTDIPSLYIGYLTSLRELYLSKDLTNENTIEVLRAVAIHCRLVETVDICARTDGIVEQLVALVSSNRRLTWLSLRQSTALTDAALIELARHCSRLTFFQMQHSPLVTDAGFLAFTMNIPNIVVMGLSSTE